MDVYVYDALSFDGSTGCVAVLSTTWYLVAFSGIIEAWTVV